MDPICAARHGRPDLRLVQLPGGHFEASVLARDRLEMVKPRCALNAASRHSIAPQRPLPIIGWEPFVVASKLYGWVIRGSEPLHLGWLWV
jgi:hypothetical protein